MFCAGTSSSLDPWTAQRGDDVASPEVEWPPVHAGYRKVTGVVGRRDAVPAHQRLADDLASEEALPPSTRRSTANLRQLHRLNVYLLRARAFADPPCRDPCSST